MDLRTLFVKLSDKIDRSKKDIKNEEATKHSLIVPLIRELGYVDVPSEVDYEFNCGINNRGDNRRIDIVLKQEGRVAIMVECKDLSVNLDNCADQLNYYFYAVQGARIAVLTNGEEYRFFSDMDVRERMDKEPFLAFNIHNVSDEQIAFLELIKKDSFDLDKVIARIRELKAYPAFKIAVEKNLAEPSNDFVRWIAKSALDKDYDSRSLELYARLAKRALAEFVAGEKTEKRSDQQNDNHKERHKVPIPDTGYDHPNDAETESEIKALEIIRTICQYDIAPNRIVYHRGKNNYDTIQIRYDGCGTNNVICYLRLNKGKGIYKFKLTSEDDFITLSSLDELNNYAEQLIGRVVMRLTSNDN